MKTLSYRTREEYSRSESVSPQGKVRKSSTERKEKKKVEATLKRLVGSEEEMDQLQLVQSVIAYIRELQSQLSLDKENSLPEQITQMFEHFSASQINKSQ